MELKKLFRKFFLGEVLIAKIPSKINGEIKVYEDLFSKRRIQVGQLTESGGAMDTIMEKAFREVKRTKESEVGRILILGLGAGTVVYRLKKFWPPVKITAVEFDPIMVEVGKKYFNFKADNDLSLIQGDAIKLVERPSTESPGNSFDLIIIDLYVGLDFPTSRTMTKDFINGLKKILADKGVVVINRLYWGKYRQETRDYISVYQNNFLKVWTKKATSNLLVFCSD